MNRWLVSRAYTPLGVASWAMFSSTLRPLWETHYGAFGVGVAVSSVPLIAAWVIRKRNPWLVRMDDDEATQRATDALRLWFDSPADAHSPNADGCPCVACAMGRTLDPAMENLR